MKLDQVMLTSINMMTTRIAHAIVILFQAETEETLVSIQNAEIAVLSKLLTTQTRTLKIEFQRMSSKP